MYYEYAVDPKVVGSSWEKCRYLSENFGFENGRLISNIPGNWLKEVYKMSVNLNDNERKKIENKLKLLKDRGTIIRNNREHCEEFVDWLENVLFLHKNDPFRAIISETKSIDVKELLLFSEIDEDTPFFKVSGGKKIQATGKSIANEMKLLLRTAEKILFVDPYFDICVDEYQKTLKECLAKVQEGENREVQCEIHYKYQKGIQKNRELSPKYIEKIYQSSNKLASYFRVAIPKGVKLTMYCWDNKRSGETHHDRYLLTNVGGVSVGQGFRAVGGHRLTNFNMLKWKKNKAEIDRFRPNSTKMNLIKPVLSVNSDGIIQRENYI